VSLIPNSWVLFRRFSGGKPFPSGHVMAEMAFATSADMALPTLGLHAVVGSIALRRKWCRWMFDNATGKRDHS